MGNISEQTQQDVENNQQTTNSADMEQGNLESSSPPDATPGIEGNINTLIHQIKERNMTKTKSRPYRFFKMIL